jgi:hypothetical protein
MISAGCLIQIIAGKSNPSFDNCVAIVDEVRSWGVIAYVMAPHDFGPGQFWIRLTHDSFIDTGGKWKGPFDDQGYPGSNS